MQCRFCHMKRILALDYGRRRIGMAVSDELGLTAQGLPTLVVSRLADALSGVADVVSRWDVAKIVVGMPLNMDGSSGAMADAVDLFVQNLESVVQVPIVRIDERWTSVAAHRTMRDMGMKTRGRKETVDRLSATFLLQIYLQQTTP